MSKKFLVAVDGSDNGWKALHVAVDLANGAGAELLVLHVVPKAPMPKGLERFAEIEGMRYDAAKDLYRQSRMSGDKIVAEAEKQAKELKGTTVEKKVAEGNPAEVIAEFAKLKRVDMLFLGSRGLGNVAELFLGGVTNRLIHISPCTCVVVK